jgi:hypothetical protein
MHLKNQKWPLQLHFIFKKIPPPYLRMTNSTKLHALQNSLKKLKLPLLYGPESVPDALGSQLEWFRELCVVELV